MKTRGEYENERRQLIATLKKFNNQACIHFAEILRLHDQNKRIAMELGEAPREIIPQAYFEAVYKILCFALESDRMTVLTGTHDEVYALVNRVQENRGFYDEHGFWIEL